MKKNNSKNKEKKLFDDPEIKALYEKVRSSFEKAGLIGSNIFD